MKATNRSQEEKRRNKPLYAPAGSWRAETVVLAALGLVALSTVIIAIVSGSIPARQGEDPLLRYLRSGRLGADMHTAKAVGHYFFEAEPVIMTNVSETGSTQKSLAMPTNNVKG
jgi:hypothetical protein